MSEHVKKKIAKLQPERQEEFREISEEIIVMIRSKYELSAHDFMELMENTKKHGLKLFKL